MGVIMYSKSDFVFLENPFKLSPFPEKSRWGAISLLQFKINFLTNVTRLGRIEATLLKVGLIE